MNGNKNHNGTAVRPLKATKRRDTLNWAHETPVSREKMLEDAVAERRLDSFFSLHELGQGNSRPFYISEVKEKFMNPDFKFFDPHDFAPQVSRADGMTVKVFAKFAGSKYYYLLLESDVHTSTLVRVGRTVSFRELVSLCIHTYEDSWTIFSNLFLIIALYSTCPMEYTRAFSSSQI